MIWTAKTMNFAGDDLWKVDVPIDCGWFDDLDIHQSSECLETNLICLPTI